MNLSICIITKNEKEKLIRAMQDLLSMEVEIVVVDTGSQDSTVQALSELKKQPHKARLKIAEFEWIDDFAAARNEAIKQATGKWIFMLDSDEYLMKPCDEKILEMLLRKHPGQVGRVLRRNLIPAKPAAREWISRVFEKAYYHYEGAIHEQLVPNDPQMQVVLFETNIYLEHDGYYGSDEERRKKATRNEALLLKELNERGDDPYLLYQLGKSYYMDGEMEKAAEQFDKALGFDVDEKLEYVQDLVETYGYALMNSGQTQKALGLEGVVDYFGHLADFCFMMGLIEMQNARFDEAILFFQKAAQVPQGKVEGVNSYLAYYNQGVIYECTGNKEKAIEMYRKCGNYPKAVTQLANLTKND
ncbi:tetratricopeptide repeat-containing glycosyltransferase family 2 protein [Eubacterium oxidoreducens]|uniref:Tetratricopeptide repeat-containing protein n=1 Tax=Eubacterium oxidoreducens TaxID=1732 RepID=A0A1G6BS91_EUBOX|nr:glycosyltransferase [Eubacterium oxidoreducens]SDB23478.1 Tetratricopeptide repeat-containing protein [Eubacterium oxidoreducens]